ncbi:MAG: glucose-6-phosphate dehydrogenase assembly protein OpcA [Aquiluna sp.]|nr:glucose-6-phosphate dehydrogenase assembly protein OpcA [Aquiluna sp.]
MIVNMERTTSSKIGKKLQDLREDGGVVALGRVLTLIIETNTDELESAVAAANGASRLHPSRIIVLVSDLKEQKDKSRLDAEIRIGGDAGASEVIIIRAFGEAHGNTESIVTGLLLPDAPVVTWWPSECQANPVANPIGKIASRRITDSGNQAVPRQFLAELAKNYEPGDGDLAWTRLTLWRSQLAAAMDGYRDRDATSAEVIGATESPSTILLVSWLAMTLGVEVKVVPDFQGESVQGITGVRILFDTETLSVIRSGGSATIVQSGLPDSSILLAKRSDQDCLIEDMRFLGEDIIYGEVLAFGKNS